MQAHNPLTPTLDSDEYRQLVGRTAGARPSDETTFLAELEQAQSLRPQDTKLLIRATDELRLLDRRGNQPGTVAIMARHIACLNRLFDASIDPLARLDLASTFADASAIAGWAALDRGWIRNSLEHFSTAIFAARYAEDRPLSAFASAQRAYVFIDLGRFDSAQKVIANVIQTDGKSVPSDLAAWLYGTQAETAAANGDADLCKRSLDLGRKRLAQAGSSGECAYVVLNELHFERWAGSCLAKLGDREAIDSLETVRSELHPDFARALGGVLVDLTQAYVAQGELDAASNTFTSAVLLTSRVGSLRQLNRLRTLRQSWPK